MERPNKPTLLGLPTELRDRIIELVVFHEKTNGIICPRPDHVSTKFRLLIAKERYWINENGTPNIDLLLNWSPAESILWHLSRRTWDESPNKASGHICTLDCLIQPGISRVNTFFREVSLQMFYGTNHFHLELGNFELLKGRPLRKVRRCPADWWRAIGDFNLQKIRELSLVGFKVRAGEGARDEALVRYQSERGAAMVMLGVYYQTPSIGRAREDARTRARYEEDQTLRSYVDVLTKTGPCVKILEHVVAWFGPDWTTYLRDGTMLDGDVGSDLQQDTVD